MHDNREAARERDPRLSQATAFGDLERPGLQREALFRAGQDRVGRLVEQFADRAVALLGDPPGPVELARLVPSWNQSEVGAGSS